ncbi:MAG: NusA-like transcription termination signal-binding factor [Candidatus Diapherotrites archaeon]
MKLGIEEIRYINALQNIAGVHARDCIISADRITFLVSDQQISKAIGKNGATIKIVKKKIGKEVELFEYSKDVKKFMERAMNRIKIDNMDLVEMEGKKTLKIALNSENRRKLMQNSGRFRKVKEIVERNYNIPAIKVTG